MFTVLWDEIKDGCGRIGTVITCGSKRITRDRRVRAIVIPGLLQNTDYARALFKAMTRTPRKTSYRTRWIGA